MINISKNVRSTYQIQSQWKVQPQFHRLAELVWSCDGSWLWWVEWTRSITHPGYGCSHFPQTHALRLPSVPTWARRSLKAIARHGPKRIRRNQKDENRQDIKRMYNLHQGFHQRRSHKVTEMQTYIPRQMCDALAWEKKWLPQLQKRTKLINSTVAFYQKYQEITSNLQ